MCVCKISHTRTHARTAGVGLRFFVRVSTFSPWFIIAILNLFQETVLDFLIKEALNVFLIPKLNGTSLLVV